MTGTIRGLIWILIVIFIGFIILIFSVKPNLFYKPINNQTEKTFIFDYTINPDESTYQTLGVSAMFKQIDLEDYEIVELYFYDKFVLEQIALDHQKLYSILIDINYNRPYDLSIRERDDDLEITIHGRFGEEWLYQKKVVYVSKYFNLIFPFIGGLSVTKIISHLDLLFDWGYLDAILYHNTMNYESPFYMYYKIHKSSLENPRRPFDLRNYTVDFNQLSIQEEHILNVTQYVVVFNS
jgi:hypothetical protein